MTLGAAVPGRKTDQARRTMHRPEEEADVARRLENEVRAGKPPQPER